MILRTLESKVNLLDVSTRCREHYEKILSLQINAPGVYEIFKILEVTFIGGRC